MKVRHFLLGGLLLGLFVSPAAAQMNEDEVKVRGRALVALWWEADGEALWDAMTAGLQAQVGSAES